jgi:hypothetical protein
MASGQVCPKDLDEEQLRQLSGCEFSPWETASPLLYEPVSSQRNVAAAGECACT